MNLIDAYIEYRAETEPPVIFHRWSMTTCLAALLGRRIHMPFGSDNIYPNIFTMLIGNVGSRKSTAIIQATKLISKAGYNTFAAEKTSKEKFLLDLEGLEETEEVLLQPNEDITGSNLFGSALSTLDAEYKEVFISADEFNEFTIGDKLDFYAMLGKFWDWDRPDQFYTSRIKSGRSVSIYQPTVSILGGNTPENFARAFPPEVLGQGFMSRLLIILGEPSDRKYHIPKPPDNESTVILIEMLRRIKDTEYGQVKIGNDIAGEGKLLYKIYTEYQPLDDERFRGYSQRRYTYLLKLCLVHMVALGKDLIDEEVVILSNTILSAAERNMINALGEFGKNKDSDVTNLILSMIRETRQPLAVSTLWVNVRRHLKSASELQAILNNLRTADLIQPVGGKGWLPLIKKTSSESYVDWTLLHPEERDML